MNRRHPTRRGVLRVAGWSAAGLTSITAAGGGAAAVYWSRADLDQRGRVDFRNPLWIPPVLAPAEVTGGRTTYELVAAPAEHEFVPGIRCRTWAFGGTYLGPTVRIRRGERVRMRVRNALPEATSVHWHGAHLPARADGGPHAPIGAGTEWTADWRVDQQAATLWYHPHPHGRTSRHVYRGLAGFLLVDDPEDRRAAALPREYGVDDLPLIVQDKAFDATGELDEDLAFQAPLGRLGDTVVVNGVTAPVVDIARTLTRLRLLNASDARVYTFVFADRRPFTLVASDGGLLPRFVAADSVPLSPGERAEIVVAMAPGERLVLRSEPPDLGGNPWEDRFGGGDDHLEIAELRARDRLGRSAPLPTGTGPGTDLGAHTVERRLDLVRYSINGQSMDMTRIDFGCTVNTTELWRVRNVDGIAHNFHVHDVQFLVVAYDGAPPPAHLTGPKDTIFLPAGATADLLMRFADHTDPDWPYMYHCHMLTHEDLGMMGQFVVLAEGARPGTPPHARH